MKKRYNETLENDPLSSRELIEAYREVIEREDLEVSLAPVHYRGTEEEYKLGLEYCRSEDPLDRATGADVLAQLGWEEKTFLAETVTILIGLLRDVDPYVVSCAAIGLGHRGDPKAIPYLVDTAEHENTEVRAGIAFGLLGYEDPRAIQTLINLSKDPDSEVRNWVYLGLGSQIDTDTAEIREALFEGLNDPDDEARGEAMLGLAVRGDLRVVDAILNEWKTADSISRLSIEAAEKISDARLLPYLEQFLESMDFEEDDILYKKQLERAALACGIYRGKDE